MSFKYYRNASSGRVVFIISKINGMVHVKYVTSGYTSWFKEEDFDRLFNPVP